MSDISTNRKMLFDARGELELAKAYASGALDTFKNPPELSWLRVCFSMIVNANEKTIDAVNNILDDM